MGLAIDLINYIFYPHNVPKNSWSNHADSIIINRKSHLTQYPLVICNIATENGHRYSEMFRSKCWFSMIFLVYERVSMGIITYDISKHHSHQHLGMSCANLAMTAAYNAAWLNPGWFNQAVHISSMAFPNEHNPFPHLTIPFSFHFPNIRVNRNMSPNTLTWNVGQFWHNSPY